MYEYFDHCSSYEKKNQNNNNNNNIKCRFNYNELPTCRLLQTRQPMYVSVNSIR